MSLKRNNVKGNDVSFHFQNCSFKDINTYSKVLILHTQCRVPTTILPYETTYKKSTYKHVPKVNKIIL